MLQRLDSDAFQMIITALCYTDASALAMTCARLRESCLYALNAAAPIGMVRTFTANLSLFNSAMRTLTGGVPLGTLHHAAYHGDMDVVQQIKNIPSCDWSTMVSTRTLFRARHLYGLTTLSLTDLTNGREPPPLFEAIDDTECTALHIALIRGWTAVCEVLLQAAPELVTLAVIDSNGYGPFHGATPLHLAVTKDSVEIARMLLANGASSTARDAKGRAPIHCVGSSEMIDALVACGAQIDDRTISVDDDNGYQLLHFAAHKGLVDVMRHICENYDVDVTVSAENTYQPVHCAAISGRVEILKFLVTQGVSLNAEAGENWTPVHCACQNGHVDTLAYLNTMGCNILALDSVGWSPLHVAIASGCTAIVSYYLDRGCDVESVAGCTDVFHFFGMRSIHLACLSKSLDMVALLLSRDIRLLDQRDDRGLSPLHYASGAGAIEVVQYLLEAGANMYAVDSSGFGSAHYAQTALLADSDDRDPIFTPNEQSNYREIIGLLLGARELILS